MTTNLLKLIAELALAGQLSAAGENAKRFAWIKNQCVESVKGDLVPVECLQCDPPRILYLEEPPADDPFVCKTCQIRALKKIRRATDPLQGRMKHGDRIVSESENLRSRIGP